MVYENIFDSICRLCLSYSDCRKMVSLIDKNSQNGLTPYAKAVSTFVRINFTKEDSYPTNMCARCLSLLKQTIRFKLVTESSDKCLKKLKDAFGHNSKNLKEKVIEYTMLKFYFPNECFKSDINNINHSDSAVKLEKKRNISHNKILNNVCVNSTDDVDVGQYTEDNIYDTPMAESITEQNNISYYNEQMLDELDTFFRSRKHKVQKVSEQKTSEKDNEHLEMTNDKSNKKKMKNKFTCSYCNKVLSNQSTYKHHVQRHKGFRYICEHCGRGYVLHYMLQIHKISKHNSGPYIQCKQCPFKAYNNYYLSEHVRIVHLGERRYKCDTCGKAFLRRHTFKTHLLRHSEKKVLCPSCPMKFFTRADMLGHMNSKHERRYIYACPECNVTYRKTEVVKRHMLKHHGIPRAMQGKVTRIMINNDASKE